ncbi:MAG: hypothetical protein J6M40_00860 [Prevotella sp.]|nr:hypothetical protein [Prevotella sp.]
MVKKLLYTLFAVFMLAPEALAWSGSGVYVGGHIRRERPATITTLKNSGFTYVILFNVSVEADGTLTTDGETWNLNQWASAMNRAFPTKTTQEPVLWLYSDNNFGGYCAALPEGRYGTGELAAWGISDKDIASFEMKEGYRLTAYTANDLTGTSREWTDTQMARMSAWANRISSLKVEKTEASAVQIPGDSPSAAQRISICGAVG